MEDRDWEILSVEVKTKKSTTSMNLAEDLVIDEYNLNEAFMNQPALFAWWATVAAQARAIADKAKLAVEEQEDYLKKRLIGELDTEVRQQLEMDGEKITETKVTNGIYCHERYVEESKKLYELKEKYLECNANAVTLEIGRDAMNQRKDTLISLGANMRNDINNLDLNIKKEQAKAIIAGKKSKQ